MTEPGKGKLGNKPKKRTVRQTPKVVKSVVKAKSEKLKKAAKQKLSANRKNMSEAPAATLPSPRKNPPGKLHSKYLEEVKKIDKPTADEDRKTLRALSISDIRKNPRILIPKKKESPKDRILNRKAEMVKRIKAYTSKCGKDSYTLNYTQVASSHEYKIGLGEIFLCVKRLKIEKAGENPIIAERMIVPSGQHKGRVGFCDINTKEYIATFSGDKVTILDDKEEVDIKILNKEDEARKAHAKEYKQTEESYAASAYSPGQGIYKKDGKLDLHINSKKNAVSQLTEKWRKKLTKLQLKHAIIIEREFTKAGLPKSLIAAAIVNAYWESGLRNIQSTCKIKNRGWKEKGYYDKKGRLREASFGLFQMNATASVPMKRGMTETQRAEVKRRREQFRLDMLDPVKNCRKVIRRIKSRRPGSKKLLAAARAGASIAELTALFCIYIEIPADRFKRGRQRAGLSMKMFKHTEIPKRETLPPAKPGESLAKKFSAGPYKRNGVIKWTNGQEKLVLGSSSVSGVLHYHLKKNIARVGIGAYHAGNFFSHFKKHIWPDIKHFTPPKTVILAGFALNGIHTSGNADKAINKSIERHKKIIRFFKAWGVKEVLIATNQPYDKHGPKKKRRLNEFNKRIREQGLTNNSVDLAKKVAPNGHCLPGTLADKVHLSKRAGQMAARMYEQA